MLDLDNSVPEGPVPGERHGRRHGREDDSGPRGIPGEGDERKNSRDPAAVLEYASDRGFGWKLLDEACPESRERMMRANLHLVSAIADNYAGRGLALSDLIEEGTIGLLRATVSFDPADGTPFSTVARWWIKHFMKQALLSVRRPSARAG